MVLSLLVLSFAVLVVGFTVFGVVSVDFPAVVADVPAVFVVRAADVAVSWTCASGATSAVLLARWWVPVLLCCWLSGFNEDGNVLASAAAAGCVSVLALIRCVGPGPALILVLS